MGLTRARGGAITFRGKRIEREAPDRIARLGIALCPRGADLSESVGSRERLCLCRQPLRTLEPWTVERVFDLFPCIEKPEGEHGQPAFRGEQQMLAIAARAGDQPAPADPRRGHPRARAADPRGDLEMPGQAARRGPDDAWSSTSTSSAWSKLADRHTIIERGRVAGRAARPR